MSNHLNSYNRLHGLTVPGLIYRHANERSTSLALSAPRNGGHRERLSYSQLAMRMDAIARAFAERGVQPGDRVALYLSNQEMLEAILTALGCYRLGAVVVPLNTRSATEELAHALELVDPSFLVTTGAQSEALRAAGTNARLLLLDVPSGAENAWPDPSSTFSRLTLPDLPDPEQPSVMLFTSGTTAKAKAVVHCHRSQLFCGYAIGGAIGLAPDDLYQGAWPIYTSSVLNLACMGAWVYGAGVVLEGSDLDNAGRLRLIEAEATTVYHGVPSILNFMVDEFAQGVYDLSRVRRIGYGGAVMPAEVIAKFSRQLPWADQVHIWGMTETGPAGTYLPPWFLPRKAGCIGIPQPVCSLKVVDEQGADVPQGQPGEIVFSGPSAALGYFRNPEATNEVFADGWVRTGDIGMMDTEGHLHFLDRKKDIINRGGLKIASAAVEDAIYRCPGVLEAAVIAVPHRALGEDTAACVVPGPGVRLTEEELQKHCAKLLADFQIPRHWFFLEALPKNTMGKILKRELRQNIIEHHFS